MRPLHIVSAILIEVTMMAWLEINYLITVHYSLAPFFFKEVHKSTSDRRHDNEIELNEFLRALATAATANGVPSLTSLNWSGTNPPNYTRPALRLRQRLRSHALRFSTTNQRLRESFANPAFKQVAQRGLHMIKISTHTWKKNYSSIKNKVS